MGSGNGDYWNNNKKKEKKIVSSNLKRLLGLGYYDKVLPSTTSHTSHIKWQ